METKMHSRLVLLVAISLLVGASMRADKAWGCPRDPVAEAKVDTKDVVHDGFDPDVRSYLSMFDGKDPYDFSYDPDNGCAPGLGIVITPSML